jgi:hypothetical protein
MAERKAQRKRKPKQVRATETFATTVDGADRFIHRGEVLPASDPVVKAHKRSFESA